MRIIVVIVGGILGTVLAGLPACQCTNELGGVPVGLDGRVCDPTTGQGLVGANVSLSGPVKRQTLSSSTGHYLFDGIPSGKYDVHAVAGAVTRDFSVDVADLARSATDGHVTKDDPACRDLGVVPGGGELDGQICNRHTESFVTNANVTITADNQTYATTTDASGSFKLPGVPAGNQVVVVRGEGYQRSFAVTITAGKVTTLDDKLAQNCNGTSATEGGMVGAFCDPSLPPEADGSGAPLVGASVRVQLLDASGNPVPSEVFNDVTDEQGTFEINGLEPGDYQVDVGATTTISPVLVNAGSETTVNDPHSQCTPPSQVGQIEGQLCNDVAGGLFHGTVDLISGVNIVQTTTSDTLGQFNFDRVAPGTYDVKAHDDASGYSRDYAGVVVQAYQTAHVDEGGAGGAACPQAPPTCTDVVNQPQVSADGRIMMIVDRSGSMGDNGSDGQPKWNSIKSALESVTSSLQSTVEFGMILFPEPGSNGNTNACPAGNTVQVDLAKNDASAVQSVLENSFNAPVGGTPTAATLDFAKGVLQPIANDGRPLAVLIATDGGPNCNNALDSAAATCRCTQPGEQGACGPNNCLDDLNTINAVGQLKNLGINVFVIGEVGAENFADVLNNMAKVGGTALPGTTNFYQVGGQADLTNALQEITNRVLSCHVDVTGVDILSAQSITVSVGNQTFARDPTHQNGWDETSPTSIDLYGAACDIASSSSSNVTVHVCNAP
jgi:hypothetical protein